MLGKPFLMRRSVMLVILFCAVLLGAAWAQTESLLYSFCAQKGCTDGADPTGGLVFDRNGNLYGTTAYGGTHDYCGQYGDTSCGAVFKLSPKGKETVLYSFCAQTNCTDGEYPAAGVVFDQKGNLYGTTVYGGAHGNGVVFKLTPEGQETILHSFCARNGCTDGGLPYAGLILDQKGNLYGATLEGGSYNDNVCSGYGCGVVFKLTPEGKYAVLYSFCAESNCTDGAFPYAGLIFDQNGNLYGTTLRGGAHGNGFDGVVFKLTPEGKYAVLHSFCAQTNCTDGWGPEGGLIFDQKGNLYGTTEGGGAHGYGTVFKLSPKGKETVLYSFCVASYCPDGQEPSAKLVFDQKGNLYGTTSEGGGYNGYCGGCGVVFKVTPKGKETVLYSFCTQTNCADGDFPSAGLVFDQKGNLCGMTFYGGDYGGGAIFKLKP
jgi:uncharacterized repeat protein (TIGR03803 family)